jgi:inactivated superfamily I helicase/RecB family exonuclease
MNKLHIYPTSRALRTISSQHKEQDGFLPALMRMDEFEQRAILIENRTQIDSLQRILLLREAATFEAFDTLNVNRDLVRFFTKSDAIFKFFEELAVENVNFETLAEADAYVEFETHLAILEQLLNNYKTLLDEKGFTDKAFIQKSYNLNDGFLRSYESIEIHLEGYLSHFELELLEKISKVTQLIIHYSTSKFNKKMQDRFEAYGIQLSNDKHLSFDFSNKKIIELEVNIETINAKVISVEEREEQIAIAFEEIEEMVQSGIEAENIVLILPDESFKEHFTLFDTHNNLNFAMGYDYSKGRVYKSLEALYKYWQKFDKESKYLLVRYGLDLESIEKVNAAKVSDVKTFFSFLNELKLLDAFLDVKEEKEKYNERVHEKYLHFLKIFETEILSFKEWLFLWLKALSKITIDDVRGGLITVMGVLETRGVSFEGVVIVDFNEGIVPASSSKDQFLNSSVRAFANLPTKNDREALQKQYYKRLLEQASRATIIYSISDNKLPSKFLYELGLEQAEQKQAQFDLLYSQHSQIIDEEEPFAENFDPHAITWSASRLKTYLDCKRKYYYRYIQKIQAKEDDELNEGLFLHSLLDHLYKEKNSYENKEEMQKKIDILLDELLPFDDAKIAYQKLLWKEKLKGFVDSQIEHFKADWKVVEREKEFSAEIGGLRFKGRIDRIDQNDTDTLVIDYKSGSIAEANRTKNLENLSDFQMSIYYHMLKPKYKNISLAFMKILEKGAIEEITVLEEKNELLAQHIIDLKQTKSFEAKKTDDLKKCKWCEFTLICERGEYI